MLIQKEQRGIRQTAIKKSSIALAFLLILAILLCTIACNSGSGSSKSESSKDVMARMMKIIPEDVSSFDLYDWKAYRELYGGIEGESSGYFPDWVHYVGSFNEIDLYMYEGNLRPLDSILQQSWKGQVFNFYEYRGVKVASVQSSHDVALLGVTCIEGSSAWVKECIDIFVDGKPSLYAHNGIKEILDRLPSGMDMDIWYPTQYDYSNNYIAQGVSKVLVGNGFQVTDIMLNEDGNFTEYHYSESVNGP